MTNAECTSLSYIRFLSFDVWGTLIKGNPLFKPVRQEIIAHAFGIDLDLIARVSVEVDVDLDALSDSTGQDFDFALRTREIVRRAGGNPEQLSASEFVALQLEVNAMYRMLPPSWLEHDIPEILRELTSRGYMLGLLSNTGFINGAAQREAFAALGVLDLFAVTIFSDEERIAKPDRRIFERLAIRAGVPAKEILHIGDNVRADYRGSEAAGITPLLYDPKQQCYENVRMITTMRALPHLLAR